MERNSFPLPAGSVGTLNPLTQVRVMSVLNPAINSARFALSPPSPRTVVTNS